jgi:hypothetical protein
MAAHAALLYSPFTSRELSAGAIDPGMRRRWKNGRGPTPALDI